MNSCRNVIKGKIPFLTVKDVGKYGRNLEALIPRTSNSLCNVYCKM